jgi:hypothetical protein
MLQQGVSWVASVPGLPVVHVLIVLDGKH